MITKLFKGEPTKRCVLILGLSIVAIFMHGYYFGVSDQEIFIPYILKSANPRLFPGDILFNQPSASASLFYPLVAFITRFLDLQTIFFVGYLTFQVLFFMAIYRLAYVLIKRQDLAIISLFPFLLPKFIGGTANYTYDTFFGYRSIGLIFLIFYLIYLFEKRYNKAATIAAIGIWFHPLSIIPNLLLLPAFVIATNKPEQRIKILLKALAIFALLLIPFFLISKTNTFSNFSSAFDTSWLNIIKGRDNYLFVSTWTITGWAALGIYLAPIAMFYKNIVKEHQQTLKLLILTSFAVFLFNAFTLEVIKTPAAAQFQLVRSIAPLAYIGLIMSVYFLSTKNHWHQALGLIAFIALSFNAFVPFMVLTLLNAVSLAITGFNKPFPNISRIYIATTLILAVFLYVLINNINLRKIGARIQYPKANSDWIDVQKWTRVNTKQDSVFLVPPDQTGFRIFSQRPIVGDIKDGAIVIYSNNYAFYWASLMQNLESYDSFNDQEYINLGKLYNFNYVVINSSNKLNFKLIYKNEKFSVYKI